MSTVLSSRNRDIVRTAKAEESERSLLCLENKHKSSVVE
jgi:hypothetical protein